MLLQHERQEAFQCRQVYEITKGEVAMTKIRYFLIRLIAGKTMVALNLTHAGLSLHGPCLVVGNRFTQKSEW